MNLSRVWNRVASAAIAGAFAASVVAAAVAPPAATAAEPSAAPSASVTPSPMGTTAHLIGDFPKSAIDRELDLIANAGASWVRVDIPWRYMETSDERYSALGYEKLDYVVSAAAKRGLRVQAVVIEFPNWANGGRGPWTPPPYDSQFHAFSDEFGEFMRVVSARYAGRIDHWELGNEVNEREFWNVPRDISPKRYAEFLADGYDGAKAGNPQCTVISAGLAGSDYGYLQELYDRGVAGHFDLLGVHAYTRGRSPAYVSQYTPSMTIDGLSIMKSVMERNGEPDKHIWVSEFGWQTSGVDYGVSEAMAASYTYTAYRRFFTEFPYVEAFFIYGARDQGTDASLAWHHYGLLRRDYSAKPSYTQFRRAYDEFVGAPVGAAPFRRPTTLSVRVPASVRVNQRFTAAFSRRPAGAGRVTLRWQLKSGSSWKTWATESRPLTVSGNGHRYIYRPKRGRWRLLVTYAGSTTELPWSKAAEFTVR